MKQVYHSNATTNIRLRKDINKSNLTNKAICFKKKGSEKLPFSCKKL